MIDAFVTFTWYQYKSRYWDILNIVKTLSFQNFRTLLALCKYLSMLYYWCRNKTIQVKLEAETLYCHFVISKGTAMAIYVWWLVWSWFVW